eukprot:11203351-Lingulodinium_polyedra.AAC.1
MDKLPCDGREERASHRLLEDECDLAVEAAKRPGSTYRLAVGASKYSACPPQLHGSDGKL